MWSGRVIERERGSESSYITVYVNRRNKKYKSWSVTFGDELDDEAKNKLVIRFNKKNGCSERTSCLHACNYHIARSRGGLSPQQLHKHILGLLPLLNHTVQEVGN